MKRIDKAAGFHFFAASVAEWRVSENLVNLIKDMKSAGYVFSIWHVPVDITADYKIDSFEPQVEGITYLGTYKSSRRKS